MTTMQTQKDAEHFEVIEAGGGRLIKAWKKGVQFDENAIEQLKRTARMPFIYRWVAAMPDTHWGMGATVGSVVATDGAIIPAAVGVDIGCGMLAQKLSVTREELRGVSLSELRASIEKAVPAGRTHDGNRALDRGAWGHIPENVQAEWDTNFAEEFAEILAANPGIKPKNDVNHLGTLGTGNHFIELEEDESGNVWLMLHSGSRGPGNRFGSYFIRLAKEKCKQWFVELEDPDLAFLPYGTPEHDRYLKAVYWAQRFAWSNRLLMLGNILNTLQIARSEDPVSFVHCHHNYVAREKHFGKEVSVTRKGAVRAGRGEFGLIPGSMGAKSYLVIGKGSRDSFESCSHGAGRIMGRKQAEKSISLEDMRSALEGVECAKDESILDEAPQAYKPIDDVIEAERDLVEVVHTFKQFVCVKGGKDID